MIASQSCPPSPPRPAQADGSMTQFSPAIVSRPRYARLCAQGAAPGLLLADGAGALALIALIQADGAVLDYGQCLYIPDADADGGETSGLARRLSALCGAAYHESPSFDAARPRIALALSQAQMGWQLYLAGSEGLIGQAHAMALAAGLDPGAIQAEHRGHLARRVQCVHCKGVTEGVTQDPFRCAHCGLALFVRDHFSRRLGAFQGVCIDAETPGLVPPAQEIRP